MAGLSEDALRTYVSHVLFEAATFEEWLTPNIVTALVAKYADTHPVVGTLRWTYDEKLPARVWAHFDAIKSQLAVNKTKTRDRFKIQIEAVLHEIRHWNQFVLLTKDMPKRYECLAVWRDAYDGESRARGYFNNRFEIDARKFAAEHLDEAIKYVSGKFYAQRVEGDISDVVEELFDEYEDSGKPITRGMIARTLATYGFVGPEHLTNVVTQLRGLEVKIA